MARIRLLSVLAVVVAVVALVLVLVRPGRLGPQGLQGERGERGEQGLQGVVGPIGPAGQDVDPQNVVDMVLATMTAVAPTSTPSPTMVPTLSVAEQVTATVQALTSQQTPTSEPTATLTSELTASPTPTYVAEGLKYQYDEGCDKTDQPLGYPACWLQRVQAGEITASLAFAAIESLATQQGVEVMKGKSFSIPSRQAALVWAPEGVVQHPADTALPLSGTKGAKWEKTLFVIDAATGGSDREVKAVKGEITLIYLR